MRDLFFSECRRFRNAALMFAAVHLVLQLFVNRVFDFLQLRYEPHMIALALYLLAALAFAMVQFGTYRQPSRWLWLLHRPLERAAIFGAIAAASAVLIVFAVGLPALLTVVCTDWLSTRVVDTRHYLLVLQLVLLTMMAWLAGSYVILNGRRSAIVVLLLPLLMVAHLASGYVMLAPGMLCLALMAYVAYGTFKPDRTAPPSGIMLAASAVPLQLGFYFAIIWASSVVYQNVLMLTGAHPINRPVPPSGGFTESTRSEGPALFIRGLAGSADPAAAHWRRQVALTDIANFEPSVRQYPVRHQLSNTDSLRFVDSTRNIEWTFSHDAMLFKGRDMYTMQDRGVLGAKGTGDATPFGAVPLIAGDYIMMPQQLLVRDADRGALLSLLTLRAPETIAREPIEVGDSWYVITNERLIAFAKPALDAPNVQLKERYSLALPGPFSGLDRIDIAPLLDGSLVSFSFGRAMANGAGEARQVIMLVDASGKARNVARRQLTHDFHALFEHHDWWISPLLHQVLALPDTLLDKGRIRDAGNPPQRERPPSVWLAALVASVLSALAGWYWLRRASTTPLRKAGWLASCLLLGPPALASMMVLQARPPKIIRVTTPASAMLSA